MGGSPPPIQYSVGGKLSTKIACATPVFSHPSRSCSQPEGRPSPIHTCYRTPSWNGPGPRGESRHNDGLVPGCQLEKNIWQSLENFSNLPPSHFGRPGSLLVTPNEMAMFLTYMDKLGHAHTTTRTYASALSHAHKMADVEDPTTKFWVRRSSPLQHEDP